MNPFALAAALSRMVTVTCPHCGKKKTVDKRPVEYRVCPRCHKHFQDEAPGKPGSQNVTRRRR